MVDDTYPQMPIIETKNYLLRPARLNDAEDMFEYYKQSKVVEYLPMSSHKTVSDTRRFIKSFFIDNYNQGKIGHFAVVDKSLALQKKRIEKKQEENRAERKKAQKEAYEKRMNKEDEDTSSVKKSDKTDSTDKTGKSEDLVTVTAGSLEELEKKIQDMLYDSMSDYVFTPQEKQVGWNVDFRG